MENLRNDFSRMKKAYTAIKKGNVRLTQSDLILIRAIDPNTTNYRFPVLENEAAIVFPEEQRLNINDEFVITQMGIFFGVNYAEDQQDKTAINQLATYAPIEQDPEFIPLKNFYSGFVKLDVNNVTFIDKWNLRKHEYTPRTQFSNFITPQPATQPQCELKNDGVFQTTPNIVLSGAKRNDLQIFLPRSITGASSTWTLNNGVRINLAYNWIVVVLRGMIAMNAAKFQR